MLSARSVEALCVASLAFAIAGCPLAKKADADAGPATLAAAPDAAAAPATAAPADTTTTPVAPLGATAMPATPAHPRPAAGDAGKPADAGAVADGGKAAPTPTPTFTIPTIPGFDAGGFKPPPGFPSTLPGFPPPAQK